MAKENIQVVDPDTTELIGLNGITLAFSFDALQPMGSIILVSKGGYVEAWAHKIPIKYVVQILETALQKVKLLQ
jgi:hypothetical protein